MQQEKIKKALSDLSIAILEYKEKTNQPPSFVIKINNSDEGMTILSIAGNIASIAIMNMEELAVDDTYVKSSLSSMETLKRLEKLEKTAGKFKFEQHELTRITTMDKNIT